MAKTVLFRASELHCPSHHSSDPLHSKLAHGRHRGRRKKGSVGGVCGIFCCSAQSAMPSTAQPAVLEDKRRLCSLRMLGCAEWRGRRGRLGGLEGREDATPSSHPIVCITCVRHPWLSARSHGDAVLRAVAGLFVVVHQSQSVCNSQSTLPIGNGPSRQVCGDLRPDVVKILDLDIRVSSSPSFAQLST